MITYIYMYIYKCIHESDRVFASMSTVVLFYIPETAGGISAV